MEIPVTSSRAMVKSTVDQIVTGMNLGVVSGRANGIVVSPEAKSRPNITRTLVNFAKNALGEEFRFTSVQITKNYLAALHVEKDNLGPSYMIGIGDYTGGAVWVQDQGALDCHDKWVTFDANVSHCTCLTLALGTR